MLYTQVDGCVCDRVKQTKVEQTKVGVCYWKHETSCNIRMKFETVSNNQIFVSTSDRRLFLVRKCYLTTLNATEQ